MAWCPPWSFVSDDDVATARFRAYEAAGNLRNFFSEFRRWGSGRPGKSEGQDETVTSPT
jgi:hypothetical protein